MPEGRGFRGEISMSSDTFRPALVGQAPIILMIAGGTNTGKSWSSLLLARGMVGPEGKIAGVCTEGGRLSSLARYHKFDLHIMEPPFRPTRFAELAETAEAEGYNAILFDSGSMMQVGPGGYRDWHDQEVTRLSKGVENDRKKHEWPARRLPSLDRQEMLYRLLQRRIPIIFSCRARELTMKRGNEIVPIGWQPIIHKELIYDVTLSFTLRPEYGQGVIRYEPPFKVEEDHMAIFHDGDLLTAEHGARLMALMRTGEPPETWYAVRSDGKRIPFASFDGWMRWWDKPIAAASPEQLKALREFNGALLAEYSGKHPEHVTDLDRRLAEAIAGRKPVDDDDDAAQEAEPRELAQAE